MSRDPALERDYATVLSEYESLGFVEHVPAAADAAQPGPVYYMPHRPVVKESSATTKVRPVFDASARGPSGLSLNDCLHVGPSLLPSLVEVLLRFRRHAVALTADICKAFLQIRVNEKDRDAHRFLVADSAGAIREFRFQRVPFGNKASPFLLNATVQHHLSLQTPSPAVEELSENIYVDDWLSGADTTERAARLFADARKIMSRAGMELNKWSSNKHTLLHLINEATGERAIPSSGTILGIKWFPDSDSFSFDAGICVPSDVVPTKRIVLSCIARFYDPLGLAAPFVMGAKILFQDVWRVGSGWDDELPVQIAVRFVDWINGLQRLRSWQVPRRLSSQMGWSHLQSVELHAFCDASEKAYGAAVYVRFVENEIYGARLVMSRARVAPLKKVTLPRLELLGGLLGCRLVVSVRHALCAKSQLLELETLVSAVNLEAINGERAEALKHFWELWSEHY